MVDMDLLGRLATKFLVGDGCWEWTAGKNKPGYGQIRFDGRQQGAHRVVYELFKGPIPEGLDLDHLCRNPGCVRPDHLEPVTTRENLRRGSVFDLGAMHRTKTHCRNGHPFDEDNTSVTTRRGFTERRCRCCQNDAAKRYRERKLATRG